MQLDTALHVIVNRNTYPEDQVQTAAMTISAEMVTHPRLLGLLTQEKETKYDTYELGQLADELGVQKAEADSLEKTMNKIKEILRNSNQTKITGKLYQVTIGEETVRTSISLKTVEEQDPDLMKKLHKYITFSKVIGRILVKARG